MSKNNTTTHYHSPTLTHIQQVPLAKHMLDTVMNVPLAALAANGTYRMAKDTRDSILNSKQSPPLLKKTVQLTETALIKFDQLFNLLVLTAGLDAFISRYNANSNKLGPWILWFVVDYVANIVSLLLKELIMKPLKIKTTAKVNKNSVANTDEAMKHVNELQQMTKDLSKDLQDKVSNNYIKPTATKIQSDYVDPTREKLNAQYDSYVKPTVNQAMETYKNVSDTYESELKKNNESIPKAIVNTGREVGNLTMQKLRQPNQDIKQEKKEMKQN